MVFVTVGTTSFDRHARTAVITRTNAYCTFSSHPATSFNATADTSYHFRLHVEAH